MSIDLILCAPTVADMRTFLVARNLITLVDLTDENEQPISGKTIEYREGFYFVPWAGDIRNSATGVQVSGGSMMTQPKTLRINQTVDQSNATEFAFNIGAATPSWLDTTVTAEANGEVIGTYDRKQGNFAVFTSAGTSPTVGDALDIYTPQEFLDQFVILAHIHGNFFNDDRISDGITGEENEVVEQWQKSALIRTIRNNATPITVAGDIQGYDWGGVKLFRAADVQTFLTARGVPGHEWLGGNSY